MPAQKYGRIYQDLKRKIEEELYTADGYLPPECALIREYDCSRNTVRRAIARLAEEGYVQSIHGRGVLVIYQKSLQNEFAFGGIESLKEAARRNHKSYRTRVIHFAEFLVDEYLHRKTGFSLGSEVFYVQRVRYFDNKAEILDNNWFLKSVLPGLTAEIAEDSVYEYLEKKLKETISVTKRKMTVERVTEMDEKCLDLSDFNCVAVVTSQTFNGNGVMFEYTQSRHRPDKFIFYSQAQRVRIK